MEKCNNTQACGKTPPHGRCPGARQGASRPDRAGRGNADTHTKRFHRAPASGRASDVGASRHRKGLRECPSRGKAAKRRLVGDILAAFRPVRPDLHSCKGEALARVKDWRQKQADPRRATASPGGGKGRSPARYQPQTIITRQPRGAHSAGGNAEDGGGEAKRKP